MCLVTNQQKAKIAKKDIHVFKVMIPTNDPMLVRSLIYQYGWYLGKVEKTDIVVKGKVSKHRQLHVWDSIAGRAYFKYEDMGQLTVRTNKPLWPRTILITEGFHSALSYDRVKETSALIYEAVIPAGSEYYKDKTGLIVSNQLMIVKEHEETKRHRPSWWAVDNRGVV